MAGLPEGYSVTSTPDKKKKRGLPEGYSVIEEPEEPEVSKTESALRGIRMGGSLGFADEAQAKVGQFLDWASGLNEETAEILGDDVAKPKQSNYESLRDSYRAEEKAASDANPWSYGLGEVAGSMIVPGGAGGGLAKTISKGALEGAVYGAGASEADTLGGVAKDAAWGGGIGGGASGLMKAGAEQLGRVANKRVKQDLGGHVVRDEAGDIVRDEAGKKVRTEFTPVQLAAGKGEEGVQKLYSKYLGMVPGSRQMLLKQQRGFVEGADEAVEAATKAVDEAAAALPKAKVAAVKEIDDQVEATTKRLMDDVDAGDARMRGEQASKALPVYADPKLVAEIAEEVDPQKVAKKLDEFWGSKGPAFQSVKGRKFLVDDEMEKMLRKVMPDEEVDDLIGRQVSGKWLMEMRNQPAIAANKGQGFGSASHFQKKEKGLFDAQIRRQLGDAGKEGDEALAKFDSDLLQYGDYQAYVKAVDKASTVDGVFTGPHLAEAGQKRSRRYGEGAGQQLGKAQRQARIAAKEEAKVLKKAAKEAKRVKQLELDEVAALAERKADLKGAKGEKARVGSAAVREGASAISEMATLGGLSFLPAPTVAILASAAGLATKPGQRFAAGQTALQGAMRNLGANEKAQLVARLVTQGMSRTAALEFVGE